MKNRNSVANEEGVTPVIAIILMVAITVVLAGVLYVWVQSLIETRPASNWLNLSGELVVVDGSNAELELSHSGGDPITWSDYRVLLNRTALTPDVQRTSVGEMATFLYAMSSTNALLPGEHYTAQVIELANNQIVWEGDMTAKVS